MKFWLGTWINFWFACEDFHLIEENKFNAAFCEAFHLNLFNMLIKDYPKHLPNSESKIISALHNYGSYYLSIANSVGF